MIFPGNNNNNNNKRTIDYNRPDIMLINILAKTAQIIEIGVPLTHNTKKPKLKNKESTRSSLFN